MSSIPRLRVFVSSPGDVAQERALAGRVVDRLDQEFSGQAFIEAVFWEHEPLAATSTFQDQIIQPSDCDVVVCILWARLGTRLPAQYTREDGSRFESGTEYEFEDAARAFRETGRPDLLVYRKTAQPFVSLSDGDAVMERLRQRQALDAFVGRWFHNVEDGTLRAAFHPFEEPGEFEDLLEAHLRKLIRRRLPEAAPQERPARADPRWKEGSPFRGLLAFDYEHADIFFGRTTEVSEVISALQRQSEEGRPFVLIVGGSGSGKSSLARAGVLPMLTEPGVVEGVATWRRAVVRPGDEESVFVGLAKALTREDALPELVASGLSVADLAELLRNTPAAVPPLIRTNLHLIHQREHPDAQDGVRRPLLALLIDQLEELFTHGGISEDDRIRFATALDHLVRGGDVWTIATLRSDVYPRLGEVPLLVGLKEGIGQYDLQPPDAANIGQMIRQPVLAAGLTLEEDPSTGERLEDLLRDPVVRRPSVLPLLEFTLEQLYEARTEEGLLTLAAFHDLGGVEGSLGRRAEEAFQALPNESRAELPRAMRSLVSVSESTDGPAVGARRAPLAEFAVNPATHRFVDALIAARLLVTDLAEDGSAVVSLAHEALLRHWPRLQEWIERDRELLKARARLRAAAFRWAEERRAKDLLLPAGKPLAEAEEVVEGETSLTDLEKDFLDRSRWAARRFNRIRIGLGVVMAAMIVLLFFQTQAAMRQNERASIEAQNAMRAADFVTGLFAAAQPGNAAGREITVREVLDIGRDSLLAGALRDVPEVRARAMQDLADTYFTLALYEQALELGQEVLRVRRDELASHDSVLVWSWQFIGRTHSWLGQNDSAAAMLEKAVDYRRRAEDLALFNSVGALAEVRREQGRTQESESLMRESWSLAEEFMDTTSINFATHLFNRSKANSEWGDFAEGERLARWGLRLTASHPEQLLLTSSLQSSLASALGGLGEMDASPDAARARFLEVDSLLAASLEISRRVYPEGHDDIGTALNNRALNSLRMSDTVAALQYHWESRDMYAQVLGPDAPNTAYSEASIAEILAYSDDTLDEARELMDLAEAKLHAWDSTSFLLANALSNMGVAHAWKERWSMAVPRLLGAAKAHRLGGRHFEESVALAYLATGVYEALEDEEETDSAFRAAITAASLSDSIQHWGQLLDMFQDRLFGQGRNEESEEMARSALAVRQGLPEGHLELADSQADMAWWHATGGRADSARALVSEAMSALDAREGIDDAWVVAHQGLVAALSQLDDWPAVVAAYRDRIGRFREDAPDDHHRVMEAWIALALGLANAERLEEAKSYADSAQVEAQFLPAGDPARARAVQLIDMLGTDPR